jgi:serine phosphatase RsbU (regulator of sigma subunit)/Tfp pilus assembly protein PilF
MSDETDIISSNRSDSIADLPVDPRQRLSTIIERIARPEEIPDRIALVNEGLALAQQQEDEQALGRLLVEHARILFRHSEYGPAREKVEEALEIAGSHRSDSLAAHAHSILAAICIETGSYHDAEIHTREALRLTHESGDRALEAVAQGEMGALSFLLGDFDDAVAWYIKAVATEEELKNRGRTAMILGNLGLIFQESGDQEEALRHFDSALEIFGEVGSEYGQAVNMVNAGISWQKLGNLQRALEYCERALQLASSVRSRSIESSALDSIGHIYMEMGDLPRAYEYHHRSLKIQEEIGDRLGTTQALLHLGILFSRLGDLEEGALHLHRALELAQEIGARAQIFQIHSALSETYEKAGDMTEALAHHKLFYKVRSETTSEQANTRLKHLQSRMALEKLEKEAEITRLKAARMEHELQLAHTVQMSLLPRQAPLVPGLEIASFCLPAMEAGGDYFDFFPLGERKLGIVIGDVTGKGMGAAIYMTLVKGMLTSLTSRADGTSRMLTDLNDHVRATFSRRSFISMIYAVVDLDAGLLTYTCAGHNPLLLLRDGRLIRPPVRGGMALGLAASDRFGASLEEVTIPLESGDSILLYTDGFSEAMTSQGLEFGDDKILQSACRHGEAATAADLLAAIRSEVAAFTVDAPQHDDMTMIVVRVVEVGRER